MKAIFFGIVVIVLMAGAGGAGYYLGDQSGFTRAQSIRADFFQQRLGGATQSGGADPSQSQSAQQGQQRGGGQGAAAFGRPVANGTVKSVNGNQVTVTQQDGSTTTVNVDAKAAIQKTGNGTVADIQPGLRISIFEQTSGGTTTQRIQLTPAQ